MAARCAASAVLCVCSLLALRCGKATTRQAAERERTQTLCIDESAQRLALFSLVRARAREVRLFVDFLGCYTWAWAGHLRLRVRTTRTCVLIRFKDEWMTVQPHGGTCGWRTRRAAQRRDAFRARNMFESIDGKHLPIIRKHRTRGENVCTEWKRANRTWENVWALSICVVYVHISDTYVRISRNGQPSLLTIAPSNMRCRMFVNAQSFVSNYEPTLRFGRT